MSAEPRSGAPQAYLASAFAQVPRLLSLLDREPLSVSHGSFDREQWGWKLRDFPVTMLQASLHSLALLWQSPFPDSPWHRNPRLLTWVEAALVHTCGRQRRNGAFDSIAPFTQDHGVTLAMVHVLADVLRLLEDALPAGVRERVADCATRACGFAARSREDYAYIANHHALFALAWLDAADFLGEPRHRERADTQLAGLLARQSPDGWFPEYGGPDPGYESLGIWYLARCWQRTQSEELLSSLQRSLDFYSHCVHPDGSVGGVYGSRRTQLYFPAGFELLGGRLPIAGAVARFMRERLARGNVVTPASADPMNLPILLSSYLEAALAAAVVDGESALPCETLQGIRWFEDSAVVAAGTERYYAVVNLGEGGACRVFDKASERVAYEDTGYVVRSGRRVWMSQGRLARPVATGHATRFRSRGPLAEVRQPVLTPGKFLLLRLLNLTLFRSIRVGGWLRRRIVARLGARLRPGPFSVERCVAFETEAIRIEDRLEARGGPPAEEVLLPRAFTPMHMGSAKYFHSAELETLPAPVVQLLARNLQTDGVATVGFTLRFPAHGGPELVADSHADARKREAASG